MIFQLSSRSVRRVALLLVALALAALAAGPAAFASPAADKKDDCKRSTVPCKQTDLSISKSAKVTGKNDFTFTITVKNNGSIAAEQVVVTDQLSKYFEIEAVNGPGCNRSQKVKCEVGTLGAGKSATITIRVDVKPDNYKGKIKNTASVSTKTKDTNSKNNSASVTVTATGKK